MFHSINVLLQLQLRVFFFQAEVTWSPGDRACTLVAALWCPAVIAGLPDAIAL
jgi:hypothetical protein